MDTIHNLFFYNLMKRRRIMRPNDHQFTLSYDEAKLLAVQTRSAGIQPAPPPMPMLAPLDADGLPDDAADGVTEDLPIVMARRVMRQHLDGSLSVADSMAESQWFLEHLSDDDWVSLGPEFDPVQMAHAYGMEAPVPGPLGQAFVDDLPV